MLFHMNIKQVRLSRKMTQKQLGEAIGVDHTIISKYEKGSTIPSVVRLEMMAKVLNVSVDELLGNEEVQKEDVTISYKFNDIVLDADKKHVDESLLLRRLIAYRNGLCELCGHEAPFKSKDGTPFLESHYVKWLSQGGSQTIDNMVVLCPNCHRRIHELADPSDTEILTNMAKQHKTDDIL